VDVEHFLLLTTATAYGKKLNLLVDSGAEETVLASDDARGITLKWGDAKFRPRLVRQGEIPFLTNNKLDGIIGCDCLKQFAMKADYLTGTLSLFPQGITEEEAKTWVTAGDSSAPFHAVALKQNEHGQFELECALGGQTLSPVIDTGSNINNLYLPNGLPSDWLPLPPNPVSTPFDKLSSKRFVVPSLTVGGVPFLCKQVSIASGSEGQVISPSLLSSRRIVYDFRGSKLYFSSDTSITGQLEAVFTPVLDTFVSFKNNQALLLSAIEKDKDVKPEKMMVESFNGISMTDFFTKGIVEPAASAKVAKLIEGLKLDSTMAIRSNGELVTVPIFEK
jgi:hypothetical protein